LANRKVIAAATPRRHHWPGHWDGGLGVALVEDSLDDDRVRSRLFEEVPHLNEHLTKSLLHRYLMVRFNGSGSNGREGLTPRNDPSTKP